MKDQVKITLAGKEYPLTWDRGAVYRADELGLFLGDQSNGLSRAAKFIFAMLPDAGRKLFLSPQDVFAEMPPAFEAWAAINAAIKAGGEETDPKKLYGSTSTRSRSSSSG